MSCKSALYTVNLQEQELTAGQTINLGNIVRRFGCNLNVSGGNIVIVGSGYYDIDAHINFVGTAGTTTITLYKDGVAIPGATAVRTTAAATTYSITIPAIVRQICNCESTITAEITGAGATIQSVAVAVKKI